MKIPGLIVAYLLDGNGGARQLSEEEVLAWQQPQGVLWLHVDYTKRSVGKFLNKQFEIPTWVSAALTATETRPRTVVTKEHVLATLRGVNLNPESDPDDMVSIRVWCNQHCIITTRKRRLFAVDDLRQSLSDNRGPRNTGDFLIMLTDYMASRMSDKIDFIEEQLDEIEEKIAKEQSVSLRVKLASVRRQIVSFRRYLSPQREALARLYIEHIDWMTDLQRMHMREVTDRVTRYVEDLDSSRDNATVTHEELMGRMSEQIDKRMYVLSLVAAIFLPLSFITGLLGANVGGIPGSDDPLGFAMLMVIIFAIVVLEVWLFKRNKWM